MLKRTGAAIIIGMLLVGHVAIAQPTGCVTEISHLGVNSALIPGEAPVIRNGVLYHVIFTNPSATDYELIAIDVSDPASPVQIGSANVPNDLFCGMPAAIGLRGTELYVLTSSGLSLYDITTPGSPVRIRTLPTVALPCGGVNPGLAVHDQSVIVLSGEVYVVDRGLMRIPPPPPPGTPNDPIVKVIVPSGGVPQDVAILGDTAVVSTTSELHAIDISVPPNSFVRESIYLPYSGTLAFDERGRLFVASYAPDHMFERVEPFSTPIPLTGISTYPTLGIAASGSLYVTGHVWAGALVHRVSDPSSPVLVGTSSGFLCESVTFLDSNTVIATSRDAGIFFLDVSGCASDNCAADYNADTTPDVLDFLDFFDDFGTCDQQPAPCGTYGNPDLNGDKIIDILDFLDFLDAFGQGC